MNRTAVFVIEAMAYDSTLAGRSFAACLLIYLPLYLPNLFER